MTPLSDGETRPVAIDPDYAARPGYGADFFADGHVVALPELGSELVDKAAANALPTREPAYVLDYHHFSLVQNKERRLAFFTAVNIDGALSRRLRREQDRWSFDPRLPRDEQTGKEVYAQNDLDLGHLVRRLDPVWGDATEAKRANDDTFHYTNCTPQHKDFNRNKTSWAGLEDYLLEHASNLHFKVCVFTGPVLAADDDAYRGVQLPRQFWKTVAMVKTGGQLSATAYLLSQQALIEGIRAPEPFSYGAYRTYQVPVTRIEQLTGLSFGPLAQSDPLRELRSAAAVRELDRVEDVRV